MCVYVYVCVCICLLSLFSRVWLFVTLWNLWTAACLAPLSMGFSRQEYWGGLPYPPPGDLPNPRIKATFLTSPALAGRFFTTSATWEAIYIYIYISPTVLTFFFFLFALQWFPLLCFPASWTVPLLIPSSVFLF